MEDEEIFIGNYRLIAKIGSGAFGHVYLAQHALLVNRFVAIKLMHSIHLGDEQEWIRFLREAQFLETLKHPHILGVIDVGLHENFPYLVTEYASKGSLRNRLESHSLQLLSIDESIIILSQIGQALQHAHQQNIIHRDLKPENILFNDKGDALLADFGVATVLGTASVKQTTITGTMAYMAPEQFHETICKESDQYALGCIAYELFTGHMPFLASNTASLITKCLMEQPIPPRRHNPHLPEHIEKAILKAMSKQRTDRFTSIAAFIEALRTSKPGLSQEAKKQWMDKIMAIAMIPSQKEKVIAACEEATQLDSDFGFAFYCKGVALCDMKRYKEALAAFEISTQLMPEYALGWYYKGDMLEQFGRTEEANKAHEKAQQLEYDEQDEETTDSYDDSFEIEEEETNATTFLKQGLMLSKLGREKEAIAIFEKAIQLDPGSIYAHIGIGRALINLGFHEKALFAYQWAIRLAGNVKNADLAFHGKGDALWCMGRYQEALKAFEQAIRLNANYADAYNGKGKTLWKLNRHKEALAAFEKAIQIDPKFAIAYTGKGYILYLLKRYNEALDAFERATKLDQTSIDAYIGKGDSFYDLKRYVEALDSYNKAIQLNPYLATVYESIARTLYLLNRYKESLLACEQAIQLDPNHAEAYIAKGYNLLAIKRLEDSLTAFDQALKLNPDYTFVYFLKGTALHLLGRTKEAQEAMKLSEQPSRKR